LVTSNPIKTFKLCAGLAILMRDTLFALDKRNRAHGVEIDRQCQNYEIKKKSKE